MDHWSMGCHENYFDQGVPSSSLIIEFAFAYKLEPFQYEWKTIINLLAASSKLNYDYFQHPRALQKRLSIN